MRAARFDALKTLVIAAIATACIGQVRSSAAGIHHSVKETSDVYVLPPAEHAVALSLGYRAALTDVLWAHVLVAQGLRLQERRHFDNLTMLLDTINELEPTFRDPYLYADALISLQTGGPPAHDEVLKAREIMERGMKNLPLDAEVWLTSGQYVAFIAPSSYLTDPNEQQEWKLAGAKMLARAAELGGDDSAVGWNVLGGAGLLANAGERDAAIRFLQRTLAVTDDAELKVDLVRKLNTLLGERFVDEQKVRQDEQKTMRLSEMPFVTRTMYQVLGPPADPALCAGGSRLSDKRCALTWKAWSEAWAGENSGR